MWLICGHHRCQVSVWRCDLVTCDKSHRPSQVTYVVTIGAKSRRPSQVTYVPYVTWLGLRDLCDLTWPTWLGTVGQVKSHIGQVKWLDLAYVGPCHVGQVKSLDLAYHLWLDLAYVTWHLVTIGAKSVQVKSSHICGHHRCQVRPSLWPMWRAMRPSHIATHWIYIWLCDPGHTLDVPMAMWRAGYMHMAVWPKSHRAIHCYICIYGYCWYIRYMAVRLW